MTARDIIMSAAGSAGDSKTYIEDVFSTYLYTGNGSTQTITNGIDLAGKGGMVWIKNRNEGEPHALFDTQRGINKLLSSNLTDAQFSLGNVLTPLSTGFYFDSDAQYYPTLLNGSNKKFASWTFRKAPKFFDVVTFTTGSNTDRRISHSLGTAPGMILVKATSTGSGWFVYHRTQGINSFLQLQTTSAVDTSVPNIWGSSAPTSTDFGINEPNMMGSGVSCVAYLFAHDTTTDGLIQCGSFTTDGSGNASVTLGWEPQYLLFKASSSAENWFVVDAMRGFSLTGCAGLKPNSSSAEGGIGSASFPLNPTATGFLTQNGALSSSTTYIYMAIRRGPMRTPTDGSTVFSPVANASSAPQTITTGFPVDLSFWTQRDYPSYKLWYDRLRGNSAYLESDNTAAENSFASIGFDNNTAIVNNTNSFGNASSIYWNFRRAPGFFDVVCYTGTGAARTVNHNLGVAPELMIVKLRSGTAVWTVYSKASNANSYLVLNNSNSSVSASGVWNNTNPTSSVFTVGTSSYVNGNGSTYVAYLFASCPGVSKVGSYTGNGSSQTINCGFTNGARFVLIKRTDSTGAWYVWDTARGIVAGNDPHLSLNTSSAEVTSDDTIDPDSSGFIVNQDSATNVNVSGGTYIYLAIA